MTIINTNVVDEMKEAYGEYALAVLVGRAIPDLYDGLKPVTRRVLTAMKWLGLKPDGRYMKAARVEGETMGKLHPHGGAYGAMVTAAQWWTNNHPLVDGWGNWGSPTDGPAAARYTEAKLTEFAYSVLLQDSDTWQTRPNYDGSLKEPVQLNVKVPNVLLNGGEGIGVGYATRIPCHNLRGVSKALAAIVEGDLKTAKKHLVPDFPTGCDVVKDEGLIEYLNTGHGSIRMRAKVERVEVEYGKRAKRAAFVFTNLPLHIDTEQVGEQIKDALAKDKITTVADVRDETDRTGVRLVVICKANVDVDQAEAEIFRYTGLDSKFSASNLVIDGTKPVQLAPSDILGRWLSWRDSRLVETFKSELGSHRHRLEIVQGLIAALDLIDDIIDEIRRSKDKADARQRIMAREFTEVQANAILDMRLSQLTKLDDKALRTELKDLQKRIKELIKLNSSEDLRKTYILEEVDALAIRYGNARNSSAVAPPKEMTVQVIKQGRKNVAVAAGPRPRYVTFDTKIGTITQHRKLPRGGTVVESSDKFIILTDDHMVRKVGANAKGPLADKPVSILSMSKVSLAGKPVIAVYKLGNGIYANILTWEALAKTTSKGKRFLPEGAELVHLGETYTVAMKGRKKDKVIGINSVKPRPVGGKGTKIANLEDANV